MPFDDFKFPAIRLNKVVFPEPFGPIIRVTSEGYSQEQCVNATKNRIRIAPIVQVNGDDIKTLADTDVATADITEACSKVSNEIVFVVSR